MTTHSQKLIQRAEFSSYETDFNIHSIYIRVHLTKKEIILNPAAYEELSQFSSQSLPEVKSSKICQNQSLIYSDLKCRQFANYCVENRSIIQVTQMGKYHQEHTWNTMKLGLLIHFNTGGCISKGWLVSPYTKSKKGVILVCGRRIIVSMNTNQIRVTCAEVSIRSAVQSGHPQ